MVTYNYHKTREIHSMKIIIVGGGKTGSALARSLSGENHDVTVIEKRGG